MFTSPKEDEVGHDQSLIFTWSNWVSNRTASTLSTLDLEDHALDYDPPDPDW
jgi:hypothetical protein